MPGPTAVVRDRQSHLFDGISPHGRTGNYQLNDITDPLIRGLIDDPEGLLESCSPETGWYHPVMWSTILEATRRRFLGLQLGVPVPDQDMEDLLAELTRAREKRRTPNEEGNEEDEEEAEVQTKKPRAKRGPKKVWQTDPTKSKPKARKRREPNVPDGGQVEGEASN